MPSETRRCWAPSCRSRSSRRRSSSPACTRRARLASTSRSAAGQLEAQAHDLDERRGRPPRPRAGARPTASARPGPARRSGVAVEYDRHGARRVDRRARLVDEAGAARHPVADAQPGVAQRDTQPLRQLLGPRAPGVDVALERVDRRQRGLAQRVEAPVHAALQTAAAAATAPRAPSAVTAAAATVGVAAEQRRRPRRRRRRRREQHGRQRRA